MKLFEYHHKHMTLRNVTWIVIGVLIFSVAAGGALSYWAGLEKGMHEKIEQIPTEEKIRIMKEEDKFTPEKLKSYLEELNVKYPEIVYAQAAHETGNFKSKIFKENNNLFGMKVATVRSTTNQGEQYGHAVYNHWRDSVLDYALYAATYLSGLSKAEYLQYLDNYAEDPNYVNLISQKSKSY